MGPDIQLLQFERRISFAMNPRLFGMTIPATKLAQVNLFFAASRYIVICSSGFACGIGNKVNSAHGCTIMH